MKAPRGEGHTGIFWSRGMLAQTGWVSPAGRKVLSNTFWRLGMDRESMEDMSGGRDEGGRVLLGYAVSMEWSSNF